MLIPVSTPPREIGMTRVALLPFFSAVITFAAIAAPAPLPKKPAEPTLRATLKGRTPSCLAFRPDGCALPSGRRTGTVTLWDVKPAKERSTLKGNADSVYRLAFSPDGTTLASGSRDGTITLWDVKTGRERSTLNGHADS